MIVKALYPGLGYLQPLQFLDCVSVALLYAGAALMIAGLWSLGTALRLGLPRNTTILVTTGIYRFTRNPLYAGAIIIAVASCCYFPDLINITFTIYGTIIHHLIILEEEKYLNSNFGEQYEAYQKKVRRYL